MINSQKINNIYLTDFSKCYVLNETFKNESTIVFQDKEKWRPVFQRNPNIFSGVNAHNGQSPTPGDDYESLAYILLYLLNGGKWFLDDIENYNEKNYESQMRALTIFKLTTSFEKQCKTLPSLKFI